MLEQFETAVAPLIGLPIWGGTRAGPVHTFQFGSPRQIEDKRRGTKNVGDYALHIQCAWNIVDSSGIIVGSADREYPAGPNPYVDPPDFKWGIPGSNRCDERVSVFFQHHEDVPHPEHPLTVVAIEVYPGGGLRVFLKQDYQLLVLPDHSLKYEHWRLFQPYTEADHFVVTGQGIVID